MSQVEIHNEELERLSLRSQEVREIMGHIPSRLIRYGISVIFTIVLLILIGTCFFRYPDIITGRFIIHSSNPTLSLRAKVIGHIEMLFVEDRDTVKNGDILAVISSTADYKDVFELKRYLKEVNENDIPYIDSLKLGEIQSTYTLYGKALNAYKDFLSIDYIGNQIRLLQVQLNEKKKQLKMYIKAVELNQKSLEIENNTYQRQEKIYKTGGISLAELEQGQTRIIQAEVAYNNACMNCSQAEANISEMEQQILVLKMRYEQEFCKIKDNLSESIENLKAVYREWENKYCIISTINGVVSFAGIWKLNQNVSSGQNIVNIVPVQKNEILARIYIPVEGSGKLKEGDRMNLIFADYPQEEYGVIHSYLGKMSLLPDSLYTSTIVLPDTLRTNYAKVLSFHQNMTGTVTIVTEDLSLFSRLLNPLRLVLTRYYFEDSVGGPVSE